MARSRASKLRTLSRVCAVGAKIGQLSGISFKVEELGRRADIIDVLMAQFAKHVERVGAVGVKLREHGAVSRRLASEIQQRHTGQAQLGNNVRRADSIED